MTVHLWRIAADTPQWSADDLSGQGAAHAGARWNRPGEAVAYAPTSISLAAWETQAHLGRGIELPWNRFLVRIDVPDDVWSRSAVLTRPLPVGWDAIPEGRVSRELGSRWLHSAGEALLRVTSVIVTEEDNVLIDPAHPEAVRLVATKVRMFVYDPRA